MIHHQCGLKSALVVGLALAACAAPAAARPDLNPPLFSGPTQPGTTQSGARLVHAPLFSGPTQPGTTQSGARLAHAPLFSGPTQPGTTQCSVVCSNAGSGSKPRATSPSAQSGGRLGFDWGDAAIGAGGAITLVVVAAGGAYATGTRRPRRLGEGSTSAAG
jgi:hypothetical protein